MQGKDDFSSFLHENARLVREYVELRMELLRLQAVRIVAKAYSQLMVFLIVLLMGLFVLFFLGMALALSVSAMTGSPIIGYLTSAAVFMLLLVMAVRFRRPLFQDRMVRTLLDPQDDEASGPASKS